MMMANLKLSTVSKLLVLSCTIFFNINMMLCDHGYRSTSFKSNPTTVKTFENDTVLLPCYHNSPFRYVRWLRDNEVLKESTDPTDSLDTKIRLWSNGSLQVTNVQLDDTGEYVCEIMTSNGLLASQVHAIEVQFPPTVVSEPSGIVYLKIGAIFEITCDAKGVPQPIMSWRINGEPITQMDPDNNRRLIIEIKDRSIAGPIECVASNKVGNPAVAGINLIVLFKPEVHAVTNMVHTKLGQRAQLECLATSAPQATIHWFRRGMPVGFDHRVTRYDIELTSNRTNPNPVAYHTKHTLVIKFVQDSDLGTYECRAENKIDFNGANIELTGRPMPSVFKPSPASTEILTHNLMWQTDSLSPILEYLLKFRQIPPGNITPNNRFPNVEWKNITVPADISEGPIHTMFYPLRGLAPASVYEVAVKARNRFGWSDTSKIVRFATGGEIQLPNYSTETIEYDQDETSSHSFTPPEYYDINNSVKQHDVGSSGVQLDSKLPVCLLVFIKINVFLILKIMN